jgi:general stress protein 26
MEYEEILSRTLSLIGGGTPALFTTIGEGGYPRTRWMMPCALPRLKGRIYAVSSRGFAKVAELEADSRVQWLFQAPDFSELASLSGRARVVDEPSFAAEVIKAIGPNLATFWRLSKDPSAIRVIETEIESASILFPPTAERHSAFARRAPGGEAARE